MYANCEKCNNVIEELCTDVAFGILTRNGLEYKIKEMKDKSGLFLIWLDFCNVSKMNTLVGYEEVNNRFRTLFKHFEKTDDLIGRCFSGDEIIIITKNTDCLIGMKQKANVLGLDFRYSIVNFTGNIKDDLEGIYEDLFKPNPAG